VIRLGLENRLPGENIILHPKTGAVFFLTKNPENAIVPELR
jgi:hypothetical protein